MATPTKNMQEVKSITGKRSLSENPNQTDGRNQKSSRQSTSEGVSLNGSNSYFLAADNPFTYFISENQGKVAPSLSDECSLSIKKLTKDFISVYSKFVVDLCCHYGYASFLILTYLREVLKVKIVW
jgi:hypothetical protein